jgi:hypothetical protein
VSLKTRNYLTAMFVSLFFVVIHLAGLIDFGGFTIGLGLLATVFAILAIASGIQDKRAKDGRS